MGALLTWAHRVVLQHSKMSRESVIRRTSARARALLVLIATMFTLWTLWSTAILPRLSPMMGWLQTLHAATIRLLLWVLPSAVYLWRYKPGDELAGLHLGPPPSLERGAAALSLVAVAALAVSIDVADKLNISVQEVWVLLFERRAFEDFQTPFFEELVFRGVIFSELLGLSGLSHRAELLPFSTRIQRAWLANLGASLVFVGMHWPWWIFDGGLGLHILLKSLPVLLLSLVLGVVFARGKSLWPCVLLHWLNNSLAQLAGN